MFACATALCKFCLVRYRALLAGTTSAGSGTTTSVDVEQAGDDVNATLPPWVRAVPLAAPAWASGSITPAPGSIAHPVLAPNAARELHVLQQLLHEEATDHAVATALLDTVLGDGAEYPGRVSLELLCLPAMGRLRE